MAERYLDVPDAAERENLATFLDRVLRLDAAAVVRFRERPERRVAIWAPTGFDALAVRVVTARVRPSDTTAAADALASALPAAQGAPIDLGYSMDSAWRGALPPESGFVHLDDVPARVLVQLAQQGAALAREHGSDHGPPVSLLDQEVLRVRAGTDTVGISMRLVFALVAMGFVPMAGESEQTEPDPERIDPDEPVRVRAARSWVRLDARFGSVTKHRGGGLPLTVQR